MVLAILQARVSSTRLPSKVLKVILGKPMLLLQLERIKQSKKIDKLIIATSMEESDDEIEKLCKQWQVDCFRGSLDDVLDRYYRASLQYKPEHIVRLTGDCPLADLEIIDEIINFYLTGNYDYVSNTISPSYPDGLDTEVFSFYALEKAWKEAKLWSEREHVTPYIINNPGLFKLFNVQKKGENLSSMRWTVDTSKDFDFVTRIFETLYKPNEIFYMDDVLRVLKENPHLLGINKGIRRNEGLQKSIEKDKAISKITKSLSLQNKAKNRIPGMTQLLSKRPDQFSLGVWPGYYSKAKGVNIWDLDGNKYIDMSIGGIGANVLGYADPDVDSAVKQAIEQGSSSSLNCPEEIELADLLCEIHPWAEKVRYARTGGESMAIAVRIARAYTGRDKVAVCGYHGWHDWYLSANLGTENALGEHLLPGLSPTGVPKALLGTAFPFRYNQLQELEEIIAHHKNDLAAVVMEPIRNDWPDPGFLEDVQALTNKMGGVLIFDEISSGFRMNSGGAHLLLDVEPDIAVFSKAIGNGYPIGAVIGKANVMEAAQSTFISSTNWTERIGPTAALATIRKHKNVDAGKHLMNIGKLIQDGWKSLADKHRLPIQVGGIAPLSHFAFEDEKALEMKALFIQRMLERGFLASNLFYSMYAHQTDHVNQYLKGVDETFSQLAKVKKKEGFQVNLKGQPAVAGFKRLI